MDIVYVGLGNAVAAALLALPVAVVARLGRARPALVRSLWLLVLLRLLAPPLVCPRLAWPTLPVAEPRAAVQATPIADTAPPAPAEPAADVAPLPASTAPDEALPGPAEADAEDVAFAPAPPAVGEAPPAAPAVPAAAAPLPVPSWPQAALAVWLAGSCLWWLTAGRRLYRFGRVARHARPAPAAVQETAGRLARRLGLARCPPVLFVPGQVPPLLWGVVGRARVLLPAALWERLTPGQRETLLAHELAHLRRGDHWVRRLELVALGLYWWHPVAWWARRRIQEAEEECCDAWVVAALPEAAADYARALLTTLAFLSDTRAALPVGASGVGQVPVFKRRLAMILQGKTPRGLSRAGLVAVLGLGAVLLPLLPSWGQTQAPGDKTTSNRVTAPATDTVNRTLSAAPDVQGGTPTAPATATGLPTAPARADVGSEDLVYGAQTPAEQVELLKAQLDVRKADVEETRALLDQARRQAARMQELSKRGAVGADELDHTHTDVKVLEARLRGKEARVREAEIQLKQAARRQGPSHTPPPHANQPAAGNHAPSADLTTPVPPQPGDRAAANPFGRPGGQPPAAGHERVYPLLGVRNEVAPAANTEQRLRELEKKIDGLLREVESLRRELHPASGSLDARPGSRSTGEPPAPRSSSLPSTLERR